MFIAMQYSEKRSLQTLEYTIRARAEKTLETRIF